MKYQTYSMFDVVVDHFESLSRKFPDRFAGRRFQMYIIIHRSIFSHSHWLRAYNEFFVFCWWREHMTNNYRICHVLTPSETNTRFICHVLTPSELFAVISHVCLTVYTQISAKAFARFAH